MVTNATTDKDPGSARYKIIFLDPNSFTRHIMGLRQIISFGFHFFKQKKINFDSTFTMLQNQTMKDFTFLCTFNPIPTPKIVIKIGQHSHISAYMIILNWNRIKQGP